jgi:hypothetical protein
LGLWLHARTGVLDAGSAQKFLRRTGVQNAGSGGKTASWGPKMKSAKKCPKWFVDMRQSYLSTFWGVFGQKLGYFVQQFPFGQIWGFSEIEYHAAGLKSKAI